MHIIPTEIIYFMLDIQMPMKKYWTDSEYNNVAFVVVTTGFIIGYYVHVLRSCHVNQFNILCIDYKLNGDAHQCIKGITSLFTSDTNKK